MLRSAREIIGWKVVARGGPAGVVRDLLVDDRTWRVRHLIVETLSLSRVRHALVSPQAVRRLNRDRQRVELSLELWEVSAAPDIEYDPPIAVQQQQLHYDTVGWRYYLSEPRTTEASATSAEQACVLAPRTRTGQSSDPYLRSIAIMSGYPVEGSNESLGVLCDFVLDDETWQIGCLVVAGARGDVAVGVGHVSAIDWAGSKLRLDLTQAELATLAAHGAGSPMCEESAA